jgi:hypothetical protein
MSPLLSRAVKATSRHCVVPNKCTDEAARAEAIRLLWPLTEDIVSWQTDTNSPELKLRAATALVEQSLAEAEAALKGEVDKATALMFVQLARQKAVPELQQARPRLRSRGHPQNIARDDLIRTAVKEIRRLGKTKEEAICIIVETLPKLIPDKIGQDSVRDILKGKRKGG